MRYVVSLTTNPGRLPNILPTLLSIKCQEPPPERIIINLPARYKNTDTYPEPPAEITAIAHINWIPVDLGPVTKLAPTLDLIPEDQDIYIMTIDDDILYLPHTTELYVRMTPILSERCVLGLAGFIYNSNRKITPQFGIQACQVIEGFGSVLYHRSFFKPSWKAYLEICLKNKDLKMSDDIIISNWLALQKIKRIQVSAPWVNRVLLYEKGCILDYGNKDDALHNQAGGNEERYARALKYLHELNLLDKNEYR